MTFVWYLSLGKLDNIITYCTQVVRVTRDLFIYGGTKRFLLFKNKAGHQARVPVDWPVPEGRYPSSIR